MKTLVKILIFAVLTLMLIGSVMVFTASGTYSADKFNSYYFLFSAHIWKVILAVFALFVFAMIPYEHYKDYSKYALLGVILLLIFTLGFAPKLKGASRWINLGFIRFQPSELAKLVLMIHLASLIEKKGDLIKDFKNGLLYLLFWVGLVTALIMVQPNISTSLIVVATSFTLLFIAGARIKHLAAIVGSVGIMAGSVMMLFSHSRSRVLSFINSFSNGSDINPQVAQAKIGLGSGGIIGVGIGQNRQSDYFLPESYGDFIFSILGEETGLLGAVIVLSFYLIIFFIGLIIAKKAKDNFGQILAFGLAFNIVLSAFINASVVTGIIPTTGITLPFISFGGTSIILLASSVGILVNIALVSHKQKTMIKSLG